jgi:hypothetical protein
MLKPAQDRQVTDELIDRVMTPDGAADEMELDIEDVEEEEPFDFAEKFWLKQPYYSDEFAQEVVERFGRHIDLWNESAHGMTVWNAYRAYHNISGQEGDPLTQISAAGEQGELLAIAIPHYRTLVRHQIALFTAERPAWDPQARTADSASAREVPGTVNLLDYVASYGHLDQRLAEQVELMMVAGAGYFVTGWDPNIGTDARGWFTQRVFAPWELCHERVRTYDDASWWVYRAYESRWDWVAKHAETDPAKARRIAELDTTKETFATSFYDYGSDLNDEEGDRIAVLYVVARPTLACPEGRLAIIASDDLVLFDGPYPYGDDITISRMCASEFLGTCLPYSDSWGVLAPAEALNAILSMILTRIDTCGVPNFCVPEGSEIEFSDVAGGNSVWKLPPGQEKPSVVDLLQIPEALPAVMSGLETQIEQVVGINATTRGNPGDNVSSGSMAALLQSMAIQFNSNLERAWVLNLERIGTHHVRVFQRMASEEHAISVMGSDNQWTVKSFKGDDLKGILRVTVKTASALSKTTAGRAEIAEKLLERGACNPQEYLRVIQTGTLEPLFAGPVGQLSGIKARCEKLSRGQESPPISWDNHELCVREFRALLDTDLRNDPKLAAGVHAAIQAQFDLWSKLSREAPDMLAAIGCPPLPMALQTGQQAQAMHNQMPGAPPDGGPPDMGAGPQQQKQPETDAPRGRPGPAPSPRGQEPSKTNPKMPVPAKTPRGESVV